MWWTVGTGRGWHFPTCPSGRAYQLSIVEAILLLAWRLRLRPVVAKKMMPMIQDDPVKSRAQSLSKIRCWTYFTPMDAQEPYHTIPYFPITAPIHFPGTTGHEGCQMQNISATNEHPRTKTHDFCANKECNCWAWSCGGAGGNKTHGDCTSYITIQKIHDPIHTIQSLQSLRPNWPNSKAPRGEGRSQW